MKSMETESIHCINCITGETGVLSFKREKMRETGIAKPMGKELFYGPGLIDIQINGIMGIDFNVPTVSVDDMIKATHHLLADGVTTYFPTVITNSDEHILRIISTIASACEENSLVADCVGGIHLEGPFISPQPGARGAHSEAYVKAPDWELFMKFQKAAGGRIKIVTLAPEWEEAPDFIRNCTESGVIVSIGHSLANTDQVRTAVAAGARMSTHLGNGIPLMIQRHPNLIWDQLAEDNLYSCIIADGIHIPDAFIKVVQKVKGNNLMIVSDATCFAGMEPGEYQTHIGGYVVLEKNKRLSVKSGQGILAGAAKTIRENVETLLDHDLFDLSTAWQMATGNVEAFLSNCGKEIQIGLEDYTIFSVQDSAVRVEKVVKKGSLVFEK